MLVAKPGLQRGEVDPLGKKPSFLAQVAKRVVGECLERLGDAPALFGDRTRALVGRQRAASGDAVAVPKDACAADREQIAFGDLVEDRRTGCVDQTNARTDEQQWAGIRKAPALRRC